MSTDTTPRMSEVFDALKKKVLAGVHTAIPAKVVRYDAAKQLADCQPLIKEAAPTPSEEGAILVEALPVVPNVPVIFPGAGGFRLTFPVKVGDVMCLIFSEASLNKWLATDGANVTDPTPDLSRHALNDGMAIPGLHTFAAPWKNAPTDRATLGKDDGLLIECLDKTIHIGGDADAAALASKVKALFDIIASVSQGAATGDALAIALKAATNPALNALWNTNTGSDKLLLAANEPTP